MLSQWGREHPNDIDNPEGASNVPLANSGTAGYWGVRQDTTPLADYTVAGVTGSGEEEDSGGQSLSVRKTPSKTTEK